MKKIVVMYNTFNDMTITNDFLVRKMIEASRKKSIECEICTCSIYDISEKALDADIILLTPLICFKQLDVEKIVDCPVTKIGMGAYASIDGKYVLDYAFSQMSNDYIA